MKITDITARLLRVPVSRTVGLPIAGGQAVGRTTLDVLLVQVQTDATLTGIGFTYVPAGGRSALSVVEELKPSIIDEHALGLERLWAKVQALDHAGGQHVYSAIDLALWDLKGKVTNLPLWRLLGGARECIRAICADTASGDLRTEEILGIARTALASGLKGLRMSVRGIDPEAESQTIVAVRDTLGEETWFAINVENPMDYETALPMARFLEEEVGADWFEDPLASDDLNGYTRLASRTDTPLAVGSRFTSAGQFVHLLETGAPVTLRPDVARLGGLTPLVKIAALAELHRRPLVPRLMPEVAVHLACGLPGVQAVEHVSWLEPLFRGGPTLKDGFLLPSERPGFGIEVNGEIITRFAIT